MEEHAIAAYHKARNRLFLLDYDGTLVPIVSMPADAVPSLDVYAGLSALAADKRNTIVIISGRDHGTLDEWLGHLPISLVAEHGSWRKETGAPWQTINTADSNWMLAVRPLMEQAVRTCPGTFIEAKTNALAWHYRQAHDETAALRATKKLARELESRRQSLHIRIIHGKRVIEVLAEGIDKGAAAQYWLKQQAWDFVLAAGDDVTDEDLFAAMPDTALTVKIGDGDSHARLHIATPRELLRLFAILAA